MAARKTNGDVVHHTVEILKDIRSEIVLLRQEMGKRFDELNSRVDPLVDLAGHGYRDHERRLRAVETKLARLGPRHGR